MAVSLTGNVNTASVPAFTVSTAAEATTSPMSTEASTASNSGRVSRIAGPERHVGQVHHALASGAAGSASPRGVTLNVPKRWRRRGRSGTNSYTASPSRTK